MPEKYTKNGICCSKVKKKNCTDPGTSERMEL